MCAQKTKPKNQKIEDLNRHPGLFRAQLSCKIGRNVLEGKGDCPNNVQPMEWAMYNLLQATEEIAKALLDHIAPNA